MPISSGGVVMMIDGIIVLFLPYETYRARGFCSRPNPYGGKAVKEQSWVHGSIMFMLQVTADVTFS